MRGSSMMHVRLPELCKSTDGGITSPVAIQEIGTVVTDDDVSIVMQMRIRTAPAPFSAPETSRDRCSLKPE